MALSSQEIFDLGDNDFLLHADDYPSEAPYALLSTLANKDPGTGIASLSNILLSADLATATCGDQGMKVHMQASGPARDHTPSSPPVVAYLLCFFIIMVALYGEWTVINYIHFLLLLMMSLEGFNWNLPCFSP